MIDAAHDMGVLSADFCKLYHSDRMCSTFQCKTVNKLFEFYTFGCSVGLQYDHLHNGNMWHGSRDKIVAFVLFA